MQRRLLTAIVALSVLFGSPFLSADSVLEAVSIPLIDLDGRAEHHVLVDKEKGQYLGHPTTCLLEDGKTILCVYPI